MSDEAKEETERPVVLAYSLLFMYGFLLLSCLRRCAKLDHEQYAQHQDDPNRETDPGVLGEAGNQISDKGNGCGNQRIRKLGSHVVYVVALCARTCHDGGIRNGRAMVSTNGPCHAGGSRNDHQLWVSVRTYCYHDGDQDTEGTP